jgi:hypothetical protein
VWAAILEQQPHFLKTFLLYSEEYALRRNDPAFFGWKGLDPALGRTVSGAGSSIGCTHATWACWSVGEAMYLHGLGVLDNLALLTLWAVATPQAILAAG